MGAVAFLGGCGGNGAAPPAPDAAPSARTLEVVAPSGPVGLAFGERATLAARLRGDGGQPVAGARIDFAIAATLSGESAGGATLSAASATTGADGEARVDVVAGAARATFRVVAEVEDALPVSWNIGVSDVGFAALDVAPRHVGLRDADGAIVVRLYTGATHCSALAAADPAPTNFPVRTLTDFTGVAGFDVLAPNDGYAVLAWRQAGDGTPAATGCVDLAPRTLRAGGRVRLALPVIDRPLGTGPSYLVASTFDLAPLRSRVLAAGAPWSRATCPLGAAELLLDCAIDAVDGTGPLDCVVEAPGALAQALEALRGATESGCRPAMVDGQTSLDRVVMSALAGDTGSPAARLAAAATALDDALDSLSLESTLVPGGLTAVQTLGRVSLKSGGGRFFLDLRTTARPLLAAVAAATRSVDGDALDLALFGYTLRLGGLTAAALRDAGVLDGDVGALGHALVSPLGCEQVSAIACGLAAKPATCLAEACVAALPALDAELAAPFVLLDGEGLDFFVEGGGVLVDGDGDLVGEQLLGGSWTATARLTGGEEVPLHGVFQARQP